MTVVCYSSLKGIIKLAGFQTAWQPVAAGGWFDAIYKRKLHRAFYLFQKWLSVTLAIWL
jgi:hypothetical protein